MAELYDASALRFMLPWLIPGLEEARSLLGEDYWSYGLQANETVLVDLPALPPRAGAVPASVRAGGAVRAGVDGDLRHLARSLAARDARRAAGSPEDRSTSSGRTAASALSAVRPKISAIAR